MNVHNQPYCQGKTHFMNWFRFTTLLVFVFVTGSSFAQNATVKGTITDDLNNFLEGATVSLSGTTLETKTNDKGAFELKEVPFGTYTLLIVSENHTTYSSQVAVNQVLVDVGFIPTVVTGSMAEDMQENAAVVSVTDAEFKESSTQSVSGVLNASRDAYYAAASYTFSNARFRMRGYDADNTSTFMNGIPMTDMLNGNAMYYEWSGLNDVMRSRDNVNGLAPSSFAFGGIGGSTYIDSRASKQRKQLAISFATSNRIYENRFMATFGTGIMKGGWAVAGSFSRRWSDEGYIPGTYYDGYSIYLAVEKIINTSHSISLTTFAAPTERGKSSPAMQELYDIADDHYYNPTWGFQNGEKRNASINKTKQPVFILGHEWKISNQTTLRTSIGGSSGENTNTALDWFNAPDPRPDYYRNLPSYYKDFPLAAAQINYQLSTYEEQRQIKWDDLYAANQFSIETVENANGIEGFSVTGRRSRYIVEERVNDTRRIGFTSNLATNLTDNLLFNAGVMAAMESSDHFKRVGDLLGGEFYVDVNQYAEQDFPGNEDAIQNDLNNPNRILHVGDKFGYDYTSEIAKYGGWAQAQWKLDRLDLFAAVDLTQTSFFRTGNMRNGLFPEDSYGDSEKQSFFNYGVKGGATFKINGRNYVFANAGALTRAPYFENAYVSARTRDQLAPSLTDEKIMSAEGGYLLRAPKAKARAVFYYTQFEDQVNTVSFYHSDFRNYVNYTITNIDKLHVGAELAFDYSFGKGLSANVVAAIGQYYYTDRPLATISADNTSELLAENEVVYAKNFYVSGTPQQAYTLGINYRAKRFWFVNLNFNYYSQMWLEFNPARRTQQAVDLVPENSEHYQSITEQQQLDDQFTMDLFAGKSWRVSSTSSGAKSNSFLVLNVGISNVLDNQDFITGGYEQLRYDFETKDPDAFAPKYFYGFGRTYFINVILRMN